MVWAQVLLSFLRLGATSFGGNIVSLSRFESEFVERRSWLSHDRFLQLLAAASLLPGPTATQMAALIGKERAGAVGFLFGAVGYILPGALLVSIAGALYLRYAATSEMQAAFRGTAPMVAVVAIPAVVQLAAKSLHQIELGAIAAVAFVAACLHSEPFSIMMGSGLVAVVVRNAKDRRNQHVPQAHQALAGYWLLAGGATSLQSAALFAKFAKIGALIFGNAYVVLACFQSELVDRGQWVTHTQLLDAFAVAQMAPGPLLVAGTFLGYILQGWQGALLSTLAIFLPGLLVALMVIPFMNRWARRPSVAAFLRGTSAGCIGLMVSAVLSMAATSWTSLPALVLAGAGILASTVFRAHPILVLGSGAAAGLLGWLPGNG
ncbi:MAG: chromate efflux transporter [Myxococcales bacterium]